MFHSCYGHQTKKRTLAVLSVPPARPGSGPGPRLGDEVPARGPGRGARVQVKLVYAFEIRRTPSLASTGSNQAYRAISTGQLNALLRLHLRPIDVVVSHGPQGYLVSRGASRLDAFSGYPFRS